MRLRARLTVYALLALAIFQAYVLFQQDRVIRQQSALIHRLWEDHYVQNLR